MNEQERAYMRTWQAKRRANLAPEQKMLENAKSCHAKRTKAIATLAKRLKAKAEKALICKALALQRARDYRASHPRPESTAESRAAEAQYKREYRERKRLGMVRKYDK